MAEFEFFKKEKTITMQIALTDESGEKGFYEKQRRFIEELKSSLAGLAKIMHRCTMVGQTSIMMYVDLDNEEFVENKVKELQEKYFLT